MKKLHHFTAAQTFQDMPKRRESYLQIWLSQTSHGKNLRSWTTVFSWEPESKSKLSESGKNPEHKDGIDMLCEEFLSTLELTEEKYIDAVRTSINHKTVFLQRQPREIRVNPYMKHLLLIYGQTMTSSSSQTPLPVQCTLWHTWASHKQAWVFWWTEYAKKPEKPVLTFASKFATWAKHSWTLLKLVHKKQHTIPDSSATSYSSITQCCVCQHFSSWRVNLLAKIKGETSRTWSWIHRHRIRQCSAEWDNSAPPIRRLQFGAAKSAQV